MKSWKTTILGLIGAVAVMVYPIVADGEFKWESVGIAAFVAAMGYFAKDKDVTGGTKAQQAVTTGCGYCWLYFLRL